MSDERVVWPSPRDDPEREVSHPGAFLDHRDDGWWEEWKRGTYSQGDPESERDQTRERRRFLSRIFMHARHIRLFGAPGGR
jgi:hypothetical protein